MNNHGDQRGAKSRPVQSSPSLLKTLEQVKEQVKYENLPWKNGKRESGIEPIYHELCLIIAEMYITPPGRLVRVRGFEVEAAIVQEAYRALTGEHLVMVVENFKAQQHEIRNTRAYLQTSLYNALFEFEATTHNDLRATGAIRV